jgi:histidine triad (HIT) family protein
MDNCIFCKIVGGEIPSYKVYEDEKTIAFLDIAPVAPGHTLVATKNHYQNIEDITPDELNSLIQSVKTVGRLLTDSLKLKGYNVTVNNGEIAGQAIPHIHFHIIPRTEGDGLELWPQGKFEEGWAKNFLTQIKQ